MTFETYWMRLNTDKNKISDLINGPVKVKTVRFTHALENS